MANSKTNKAKAQKAKAKLSWIGFNKQHYKSVKFVRREHRSILNGAYVKFRYGIKNTVPMFGRVYKISKRGVELKTDCGYYNAIWKRIEKIFIPKRG